MVAQVGLDAAAAAVEQFAHAVTGEAAEQRDADQQRHRDLHLAERLPGPERVDAVLQEAGTECGEEVGDDDEDQAERVGTAVGPEVGQQRPQFVHKRRCNVIVTRRQGKSLKEESDVQNAARCAYADRRCCLRRRGQAGRRHRGQPEPRPAARAGGHDGRVERSTRPGGRYGAHAGADTRASATGSQAEPKPKPAPKPATAAPSTPAARRAGSSRAPVDRSLAVGMAFAVSTDAEIRSHKNKVGDEVTATVANDVKDPSGQVVIPAGSKVTLQITAIKESENKSDTTGTLTLKPFPSPSMGVAVRWPPRSLTSTASWRAGEPTRVTSRSRQPVPRLVRS